MGWTNIPYADYAWNPVVGCTPTGDGCKYCWARRLHNQRWRAYQSGKAPLPKQYAVPFERIQLRPDRLDQPVHWRKPRTVFVNSMSDTFHRDVPWEFQERIFTAMRKAPQHTYLLFTKRPKLALAWYHNTSRGGSWEQANRCFFRQHVHLYFSASTQGEVDRGVRILLEIPAAVRGLSIEPLLGPVELNETPAGQAIGPCGGCGQLHGRRSCDCCMGMASIDSIIVGCESGWDRRPCDIEWIKSIVEQCREAGVKVYVKQMEIDGKVETDMSKFPTDLQIREM